MKIHRADLAQIASNFLELLEQEGIRTKRHMEAVLGRRIPVPDKEDAVDFRYSLSGEGNKRIYVISYVLQSLLKPQIPLHIILDPGRNYSYSEVMVKSIDMIPGYGTHPATQLDEFRNVFQYKRLDSMRLSKAKIELEELAALTSVSL